LAVHHFLCDLLIGYREISTMQDTSAPTRLLIRVPKDAREWLKAKAAHNVSSMAAEVIRSIRDRMDAEQREKVAR
jgi:hypothetical protein